jgi:hypothetical protein
MLIRMKFNYAHPAVQIICADVHFFVLIRTGVSRRFLIRSLYVELGCWRDIENIREYRT